MGRQCPYIQAGHKQETMGKIRGKVRPTCMGTATYNGRIFAKLLTTEMTKFQLTMRPRGPAHTCVTSISKLTIVSQDDGLRIPALGFQQSHQCIEHVCISQIVRVWSRVIHCFIACLSVCHPRCVLLSTMEIFPSSLSLG